MDERICNVVMNSIKCFDECGLKGISKAIKRDNAFTTIIRDADNNRYVLVDFTKRQITKDYDQFIMMSEVLYYEFANKQEYFDC